MPITIWTASTTTSMRTGTIGARRPSDEEAPEAIGQAWQGSACVRLGSSAARALTTTLMMIGRPTAPWRILAAGVALSACLALLVHSGAIGHVAYQAGLSALLLAGVLLVFVRALRRDGLRRGWVVLSFALFTGMGSVVLIGWEQLAVSPSQAVRTGLAAAAFLLSISGLAVMLADRPNRMPLGALLDGMTAALVAQAAIAGLLLSPTTALTHDGFDAAILLYPLGDVLLMGLVGAAVAHGGWRADGWALALAGIVALTVGDSAALAASLSGTYRFGGLADFGWVAGTWLLAVTAWGPDPKPAPGRWVRPAVPVVLGTLALAILVLAALADRPALTALGCAAGALAVVVARLAITLQDNGAMLEVAREESATDALTGLANRRRLMADLEDELLHASPGAPAALALYDLNGFKDYNDTFGHPAGDALLVELGASLAAAVDGVGTAYRMGGDEFCVLIGHRVADAELLATRAAGALTAAIGGFTVSAAHGVVLLPADAANASDALRRADLRMYEHKEGGRAGARRQVTQTLLRVVQERDADLHGHGEGVQELAARVARRLGLSDTDADAVRLGALLHDIGKLAIPDRILEKRGALDPREREFVRGHTLIGQRILDGAPALRDVALLVRSSHERFDGAGYPDGLRGAAIPLGARIIAVCDAFDAMTHDRAYRAAIPEFAALAELQRCAGSQFDPEVVAAFVAEVDARAGEEPLAA
jgi:diguanylate cyclase (GGDEF)-like protein/putative nucleotidyltransferase with HDIG domain